MDIEKKYDNVYRTMNKNELNNFQFDCPVKIVEWVGHEFKEYFPDYGDISRITPVFGLPLIIDTQEVELRVWEEDNDWMSQFLPDQKIPKWLAEIEGEAERKEMMELMGVGEYFDITQSPFYNKVIFIGF